LKLTFIVRADADGSQFSLDFLFNWKFIYINKCD